jgi:hypothetical protein
VAQIQGLQAQLAQSNAEIAWLRNQVAESRASVVAMADTRAHAQMEYFRAVREPAPVAETRSKVVASPPEASVHYSSLMAEGHIEGPVHEEDEEALFVRERERDLAEERSKVEGTDS